jgi:protein involved in polysaccharide export with SLBB domain
VKTLIPFCLLISGASLGLCANIVLQPGDSVDIAVYNSPELSGNFRINTDGFIRLPLVGKIQAAGKSEDDLHDSLRKSIDTFIKNPYITVIPKYSVSVLGYVVRPGSFEVTGSERIIELISQAGGFNPEASGNITLYRNGVKTIIAKNSILYNDPKLGFVQPRDIITAGKKRFTTTNYSMLISTLTAVSIILYYNNR